MRKLRLRTLRWIATVLLLAVFAAIVLRWISLERLRWTWLHAAPVGTPTPLPSATATPRAPVIGGKLETARLFSGITVHSEVDAGPGGAASEERADPDSYALELKLRVKIPQPNKTIEELAKVNTELPRLLPGLAAMIHADSVSPYFSQLYETKLKELRANLGRLDQLLSRHNFYDCQTILLLRHPQTQRKAVLVQADMDVDADGSDADRLPTSGTISPTTKPITSYRWPKKTHVPNPYVAVAEERLKRYQAEAGLPNVTPERKRDLRAGIQQTRDEIDTLKRFSFLIGATDPFIVVPGNFAKTNDGAKVGDYAVVIFGDRILPAIVGDVGPADKAGEASLRIAKEINALTTPNNRPVSDLKVTYLIFPGTAETPFGPPDLEKLHARCETLVNEIGGATVPLHKWVNIIPPPPTPTPSPSPSPSPTATPTEAPTQSPEPSASPSATP